MGTGLRNLKQSNFYRLLKTKGKPHVRRILTALPLMAITAACTGALAFMVRDIFDEIFINKDYFMLYAVPAVLIALYAVKGVSTVGHSYLMAYVGQRIMADLRDDIYAQLQRLSLSYYDKSSTGELMSRITNDVNLIQGSVSNLITSAIKEMLTIVSLVVVIIYMDWLMAIFALLVFPVCVIPLIKFGRRLRKISKGAQESMADLSVFLNETLRGATIVKGFCREEYETKRFKKETERLFGLQVKHTLIRSINHPVMELLASFGLGGIILYAGNRVFNGDMTLGQFGSFIAALLMLYEPLKKVTSMNHELQNGLVCSDRIFEILDTKPDIMEKPGAKDLPLLHETICFKDMSFGYRQGHLVLKDINLTVQKGEALAIVGTSGGGKTTMVKLLPRFYDVTSGSISIDGTDIRDVTLISLRSQIAIVTQQIILFNDTVTSNIAYGREGATTAQIEEAARASYAHEFIKGLPNGYDTVIGESGVLLSGGQRQRLSIARAILSDKPILILDEATSNLDTESEHYVQMALENLMRGRTTFVIAHRLSTVKRADRIVVVDGGSIVEEGKHQDLMDHQGVYHKLHNMQFCIDHGLEALSGS